MRVDVARNGLSIVNHFARHQVEAKWLQFQEPVGKEPVQLLSIAVVVCVNVEAAISKKETESKVVASHSWMCRIPKRINVTLPEVSCDVPISGLPIKESMSEAPWIDGNPTVDAPLNVERNAIFSVPILQDFGRNGRSFGVCLSGIVISAPQKKLTNVLRSQTVIGSNFDSRTRVRWVLWDEVNHPPILTRPSMRPSPNHSPRSARH